MAIVNLTGRDIYYLENLPMCNLTYNHTKNVIVGTLGFEITYGGNNMTISDEYTIEINLNRVSETGVPIVRETGGKILMSAFKKRILFADMHLNTLDGEMCLIIPPKAKERYPNGFDLKELLHHIEEHLYWVSYFDKYNEKPWDDCKHNEEGYLDLLLEDPKKYGHDVRIAFGLDRATFRRGLKQLKKKK